MNTRSEIQEVIGKEVGGYLTNLAEEYQLISKRQQEIIGRDYSTFSGLMLERYFHRLAMESGEFTCIGRWWDRKGENEIDIIAEDQLNDKVTFCEIKRRAEDISIGGLKQRTEVMLQATHEFKRYEIAYKGLSMEEM